MLSDRVGIKELVYLVCSVRVRRVTLVSALCLVMGLLGNSMVQRCILPSKEEKVGIVHRDIDDIMTFCSGSDIVVSFGPLLIGLNRQQAIPFMGSYPKDMKLLPIDPFTGRSYRRNTNRVGLLIWSPGPDGVFTKDASGDDIVASFRSIY